MIRPPARVRASSPAVPVCCLLCPLSNIWLSHWRGTLAYGSPRVEASSHAQTMPRTWARAEPPDRWPMAPHRCSLPFVFSVRTIARSPSGWVILLRPPVPRRASHRRCEGPRAGVLVSWCGSMPETSAPRTHTHTPRRPRLARFTQTELHREYPLAHLPFPRQRLTGEHAGPSSNNTASGSQVAKMGRGCDGERVTW